MKPGDWVGGRFLLEALAGEGAMGVVYRARDVATSETVAVKFLTGGRRAGERFLREIEVLARLQHPRIVRYVAHGAAPDGSPFLAMEWLDGPTLEDRLDERPLTLLESIDVAGAISEALVTAHAGGIVHRDLKPANVVLVRGSAGAVKVVDFGVARIVRDDGPVLTSTGEIVGTPAYMSPEQALSKKDIDGRSDLFSLGSILYRTIAGVYPFEAETALRLIIRLTSERAAPIATVAPNTPPKIAALIDALLAPEPRERPESAVAVHAALTAARSELAATAAVLVTPPSATLAAPTPPAPLGPPTSSATLAAPTPTTIRQEAKRGSSLWVTIIAGSGVAFLVLGGVLVWLFVFGPLANDGARRKSYVVATANPTAVAGPTTSLPLRGVADPSHVDPLALAKETIAVAKTYDGGALVKIYAREIDRDGVDLANGGQIEYSFTKLRVLATSDSFSVTKETALEAQPIDLDKCACAYRKAYAAGFAAAARFFNAVGSSEMSLEIAPGGPEYRFNFGTRAEKAPIRVDARDCTPRATTERPQPL